VARMQTARERNVSDSASETFWLVQPVHLPGSSSWGRAGAVIETIEEEGACPTCGVLSSRVKERPPVRLRDLSASGQRVQLWCRRRRLGCRESAWPRGSFTQVSAQVPARARVTTRVRQRLTEVIAGSNRAVAEVVAEHCVAWHTAHPLVAAAARWLPEPTPTGTGDRRDLTRRVRWILRDAGGRRAWRRSDPWMTSFLDADPARAGLLLGPGPGRSGACVRAWLAEQTADFRDAVQLVVIDPSAPYASGIRTALPRARIAVDKWCRACRQWARGSPLPARPLVGR